jgi:hypothetical protein
MVQPERIKMDNYEKRINKLINTYLNEPTKRLSEIGMGDLMAMRTFLSSAILHGLKVTREAYCCGEPSGEMAQECFERELSAIEEHTSELVGLERQVEEELSKRMEQQAWKCIPTAKKPSTDNYFLQEIRRHRFADIGDIGN